MANQSKEPVGIVLHENTYVTTSPWWGAIIRASNSDTSAEELTELAAQDAFPEVLERVQYHSNCPPLVKAWIESGRYGGMTLKEFLESARDI